MYNLNIMIGEEKSKFLSELGEKLIKADGWIWRKECKSTICNPAPFFFSVEFGYMMIREEQGTHPDPGHSEFESHLGFGRGAFFVILVKTRDFGPSFPKKRKKNEQSKLFHQNCYCKIYESNNYNSKIRNKNFAIDACHMLGLLWDWIFIYIFLGVLVIENTACRFSIWIRHKGTKFTCSIWIRHM